MEFIEDIINSSMFYYILVAVTYVLVILFVIMLIISRKKKKRVTMDKPKDIDSIDLESVLGKMQEDVSQKTDVPRTFEEEQEEKAIISYQELLHAVKKDVNDVTRVNVDEVEVYNDPLEERELPTLNSIINKEDTSLEPIVLANELDVESDEEVNTVDDLSRSNTRFQNSEFISPIYGRVNNEIEYPKIPSIKVEEDNKKEIKNFEPELNQVDNDKFLSALKNFRNNLE